MAKVIILGWIFVGKGSSCCVYILGEECLSGRVHILYKTRACLKKYRPSFCFQHSFDTGQVFCNHKCCPHEARVTSTVGIVTQKPNQFIHESRDEDGPDKSTSLKPNASGVGSCCCRDIKIIHNMLPSEVMGM